jgi:uracil-DNA glycosylase family 4
MQSKDEGSKSARFVLLGEAYGHWEEVYSRPFVGPSYTDKLLPWWNTVGLTRDDFFITNVWDQGQPASIGHIDEQSMRASMDRLHDRLATIEGPDGAGPYVIVCQGNYALYALTGLGVVSFHSHDGRHKRPGILDWRGSILSYTDRRGRVIKVIPTPHPAFTFRSPQWDWVLQADWKRIAEDGQFRELRIPQRTHMIAPSKAEAIQWMHWTREEAARRKDGLKYFERLACSLDVETPFKTEYETRQKESTAANGKCRHCGHTKLKHGQMEGPAIGIENLGARSLYCTGSRGKGCEKLCIMFTPLLSKPRKVKVKEEAFLGCNGYAWSPLLSMTIPTTLEYWQDPVVWATVKAEMAAFHADSNVDFGGQNFPFDAWWLAEEGMPLHDLGWDLMKMHRVQRPWSEWHDLGFQLSIDTRMPFYKHEAKLPDEISRWSHNKEQLWTYNGKDNCGQIELLPIRLKSLQERGRLEYYDEMEAPIDLGLLELSCWGMRADVEGRAAEFERVTAESSAMAKEINDAAGMKVTGKIAISNDKMKMFLYGDGVPEPIYDHPMVEVTSKTAKCTACSHPKAKHDIGAEVLNEAAHPPCIGSRNQPCACTGFVAPMKPGKKVKIGEKPGAGGLRLPVQYTKNAKKEKVVSTNIVAIKRLMEQFPTLDKLQIVGGKVIKHRRLRTIAGFVKAEAVDPDGRLRAQFRQDTLLGRLSSSQTPKKTGRNLQNIDRKLRRFFLPDTGEEAV